MTEDIKYQLKKHHTYNSIILFFLIPFFLSSTVHSSTFQSFEKDASFNVYFSPNGGCIDAIISTIQQAKKSILVQARTFRSNRIAKALVDANNTGVIVKIIFDKVQCKGKEYKHTKYLNEHQIPIWIDWVVKTAHNKVMIIDNKQVITGSFNFNPNSETKKAENLLIINSPKLAILYMINWDKRLKVSQRLDEYMKNPNKN